MGDFPGGPVVKTSPSSREGVDLIPGHGAKMPYALGPKKQNIKQKQYGKNFNKNLKMIHIKKSLKKKRRRKWEGSSGEEEVGRACNFIFFNFISY